MSRLNQNPGIMAWSMTVALAVLAVGCQGNRDPVLGGPSSGTMTPATTMAPQVSLTVPATQIPGPAVGLATNSAISASFTEAMAPATLNQATFTLTGPGAAPVQGVVSYALRTAIFTPSAGLTANTTYTATITRGAEDLNGNELDGNQAAPPAASNYVWTFTTGSGPDTTAPQVSLTFPATTLPGPTAGLAVNSAISATFTKPLNPATLSEGSFTVSGPGGSAILGTVTYASGTAVFMPLAPLSSATTYTATLGMTITDLAGNELSGNQAAFPAPGNDVWTFTTTSQASLVPPQVTLTVPATTLPGHTPGVASNAMLSASFTEAMNPATLTTATFTLTGPKGAPVAGNVCYASGTAMFMPSAALANATTYTARISGAVQDLAGNDLAGNQAVAAPSDYVWTFTTGLAPDTIAPGVTLTVPATTIPGPTSGFAVNAAITVAFTKAMNPATLTTASFTVTGPAKAPVAGGVSYASGTAIFSPSANLADATTYTATLTTAVQDLAGNPLIGNQAAPPAPSDYVWTFTTGSSVLVTKPMVANTTPMTMVPGPTANVPANTAITAAFTEAMNPATLNAASFTVTTPLPGVNPLGSIAYAASSRTVIFTPAAPLAVNTTYTATITTAAQDLAGNQLAGNQAPLPAASNYVWTFTTGTAVTTAPTLTLTVPANGAQGVQLNAAVNATFSEGMNPATLTTATFQVQTSGTPLGSPLSGTLTYDPVAFIATFTPSANLAPNTSYTATLTGATDLTGDALQKGLAPNPWTFTTGGSGVAAGTVVLGSASTFGIMATSAITSTGATIINGDVSLNPGSSISGFPPGVINGALHLNDTEAAQARIDLLTAYNYAKNLPPGTTVTAGADLGAVYPLGGPPGTYTTGSTLLVNTPLTLDAGGNTNAVWVFQIGSSFTTGAGVILANGAQAKNVFWVPTLDGTVGVGTTFCGTIVAGRSVTGVTGSTINGRILAGATTGGTIALQTTTVNVPAP